MNALLKKYIMEVVAEMNDPRVPNQLVPRGSKKQNKTDKDSEEEKEMEEMSVAANVMGYSGPLGASSADMGANPVKPGGKLKKRKKTFVRWK